MGWMATVATRRFCSGPAGAVGIASCPHASSPKRRANIIVHLGSRRAAREVAAFFDQHDLFLSPVHAVPPIKIGELTPSRAQRLQLAVDRDAKRLEDQGGGVFARPPPYRPLH